MEPTPDELLAEAIRLSLLDSQECEEGLHEPGEEESLQEPGEPEAPSPSTGQPEAGDESIIWQLVAMSFPEPAARQAVMLSGGQTVDSALSVLYGEDPAAATIGTGGAAEPASPFVAPIGQAEAPPGGDSLLGDDELSQEELLKLYGIEGTITNMQGSGEDTFWRAKVILDKLLGNILSNPDEPRYRKVNTRNKRLAAELFSVPGARQLLLQIGFEPWLELCEEGSVLVLPMVDDDEGGASLAALRQAQSLLMAAAEAFVDSRMGGGAAQSTYRCQCCHVVIDSRRRSGARAETWQDDQEGMFRYHCRDCTKGFDLCEKCFDTRTNPPLSHPPEHQFEIIAPDK